MIYCHFLNSYIFCFSIFIYSKMYDFWRKEMYICIHLCMVIHTVVLLFVGDMFQDTKQMSETMDSTETYTN